MPSRNCSTATAPTGSSPDPDPLEREQQHDERRDRERQEHDGSLQVAVVRNRQALVDAARTAFGEHGLQAALEPIAVAAGLGNATLYRHFPTRAALWQAVLTEPMQEVLDLVDRCRTLSTGDPWSGSATFVRVQDGIDALFRAAQDAGAVRTDAVLADVAMVQLSIATTIGTFGGVAPDAFRRWVDLALDALRAPEVAREPLRARPLRGDQVR